MVDFVLVHIAEGHATDLWPIRSARANGARGPVNISSHQNDEERALVAMRFVKDFNLSNYSLFPCFCEPPP
jgi:hypothetical protein